MYTVCEENLCENGGTCLAYADTYNCTCLSGYTGTLCETSLDGKFAIPNLVIALGYMYVLCIACNERVCENGGTCMADAGTYSCTCPTGYTGAICETTLDVSDGKHTTHNLAQFSKLNEAIDIVIVAYILIFLCIPCDESIILCENEATCMADAVAYSCTRPTGYTGAICETT